MELVTTRLTETDPRLLEGDTGGLLHLDYIAVSVVNYNYPAVSVVNYN